VRPLNRDRTCQSTRMPAGDSDLVGGVWMTLRNACVVEDRPAVFLVAIDVVTITLDVIKHWIFFSSLQSVMYIVLYIAVNKC